MRLYLASSEETLRARGFLKDWAGEGFLTPEQYRQMEPETVSDLRTTNIFLRIVLFLFTLIIVGAAAGLFFEGLLSRPSLQTTGVLLVIFAAVSYAAAEVSVAQARLYRHGIEEALAAGSVGFLCVGMLAGSFGNEALVSAVGAVLSLWIWHRFGLLYAFLAAMVFAAFVPGYWASSHSAQHAIVAGFYAIGLIGVAAVRPRHRFDHLNDGYSFVEALLWLGVYVAINLQLSSLRQIGLWFGGTRADTEFSRPFYWTTWVLIWCLPPVILARGLRRKDRPVIAAGAIAAILTLISNKPYLGWPRHTWDPMLLGALLIAVALFLRRWLARGEGGIRHGFTAERLSGKDKKWMSAGTSALGLFSPPAPHASSPEVRFEGGKSGGGGASGDF